MPRKDFNLATELSRLGPAIGKLYQVNDPAAMVAQIDAWLRELEQSQRDLEAIRASAKRRVAALEIVSEGLGTNKREGDAP